VKFYIENKCKFCNFIKYFIIKLLTKKLYCIYNNKMSSFFSLNYGDGTSIRDNSNNELLSFNVNANATNNLQITNNTAAGESNVSIDVIGSDTDIGLNLNPKGHGRVNILGSTSNSGGIRFYGDGATDSSNYVGLSADATISKDINFVLPSSDGTNGQVLQTNGSGTLSFTTVSGSGTPDTPVNSIQFNDAGSFGGISTFTSDGSNLTISGGNLDLASGDEIQFAATSEKISGDGSNLTINSGRSILLTATSNVIIPSSVPLSFATDDAEKITGNGTDLTVASGRDIVLNPTGAVVIDNSKSIEFGAADSGESITGDGSNLTVNSGRSILLTATSNVIIPSSVPLSFATDDAEKITGDGTDLTINSGRSILLTATSNVVVPSLVPIEFGSSDVQMQKINAVEGLFNANLSVSTIDTGIDLGPSGNVYISGSHLVLSHEIVSTAPSTYWPRYNITLFNLSSGTADNTDVSGNPVSQGASWHVLFDNTGNTGTSLAIDFGSDGLVSGSGLAQTLTFSTTGQSASLIYLGGKWRIINTGAAVS
jgi:hypothetical protein